MLFVRTVFSIPKMDCPSEEQLIRLALSSESSIKEMKFDLNERTLTVLHSNDPSEVMTRLIPLNLGAHEMQSEQGVEVMAKLSQTEEELQKDAVERRTLVILLLINASMFIVEIIAGFLADSTGLIADSFDMLADALVYSISIFAVGKIASHKKRAARMSGWFQMLLAFFAIFEVIRRFIYGSEPESFFMVGISTLALAANLSCLWLISKHRHGEIHMKASWIFSTNDVLANIGVLTAGILVALTHSRFPDLIIGSLIAFVVFRGAFSILKIARA